MLDESPCIPGKYIFFVTGFMFFCQRMLLPHLIQYLRRINAYDLSLWMLLHFIFFYV